jgi:hypothetical protein
MSAKIPTIAVVVGGVSGTLLAVHPLRTARHRLSSKFLSLASNLDGVSHIRSCRGLTC